MKKVVIEKIKKILEDKSIKKIGQNIKFDNLLGLLGVSNIKK